MTPDKGALRLKGGLGSTWRSLVLLTATNTLMSLDRTIPQLVAEPVKREFNLTDTQLGVFIGLAFGLSYGLAGLVIGPLIDRYNRKTLLATILSIWSAMTFITGLAGSYATLLVTRAGLGAAEAGGNPAALSLIGDLYPPEKRSGAIGIYKVGVPLGIFLASALIGLLVEEYGWRSAFFVAGLPGFVTAAALIFAIKEPERGRSDAKPTQQYRAVPYFSAIRLIFRDPQLLPLTAGLFISIFSGAAIYAFVAPFLQRYHDLNLSEVGMYIGLGSAMAVASPILVGFLANFILNNTKLPLVFFLAGLNLFAAIAAVTMLLHGHLVIVLAGLLTWQFVNMGLTTPGMAALITLTPLGMRGTSIALISVGNMLLGFGLGPLAVGYVSDLIGSQNSLQMSLLYISASGYLVSTLCFVLSGVRASRV